MPRLLFRSAMTTIAVKDGVMASDGRVSGSQIWAETDRKIFRIRRMLVGLAGDAVGCNKLLQWLHDGGEGQAPKAPNTSTLLVHCDGTVWAMDDGKDAVRIEAPTAIGSGAQFAIGAMLAGKSAAQAVRIAMKRDPNTGGRIRTLRLR